MPSFAKRSGQTELLDRNDIPFKDILLNMQELHTINHLLGGHRITCKGLAGIIGNRAEARKRDWLICEIGCGDGNNLRVLKDWCQKQKITARFIGIDSNPHCIASAAELNTGNRVTYYTNDYSRVVFEEKPDIIFSSLFCHHFTDQQLQEQMRWLGENSTHGFFINDLHRHPLAYYSIRILTKLFSSSYLVKNDAPISVLRGFRRKELAEILSSAGIDNYSVKWNWAFRWLIVIVN